MFDQVSIVPNESLTGLSVQEVRINWWIVDSVLSIPRCRMVMFLAKVCPYNCQINELQMMTQELPSRPVSGASTVAPPSVSAPWLPHFSEHLAGVERCHLQLQEKMVTLGTSDVNTASRSLLFDTLKLVSFFDLFDYHTICFCCA
jgi:hypothetical protein